jgi:hypothetical protein
VVTLLVAGIIEVAKWVADEAVTIAVVIWNVLRLIGGFLIDFGVIVAKVFVKVWDFFGRFYTNILRPFVSWTWNGILKLHTWLKTTLTPVLKFLQAARVDILQIYNKWLKPIFTTIDVTRSLLRVLETFHVGFAQKLDAQLAALENRLLVPIRFALAKINEASDWINRIIDLDGVFQRLTLIASLLKYERDMWGVWWTSVHRREVERNTPAPADLPTVTPEAAAADAVAYASGRDNEGGALVDEHVADLRLWLEQRVAPVL